MGDPTRSFRERYVLGTKHARRGPRAARAFVASGPCGGRVMLGNVEVDELVSLESLEDLQPEWATLWERAPRARTFQRPEWLIPWIRHLGPLDPCVLTLRRRGSLVGVVPL